MIIILILLSGYTFFNYRGLIGESLSNRLICFSIFIGLIVAILNGQKIKGCKDAIRYFYIIVSFILISILSVSIFHEQSLTDSIYATLITLCSYLTFYIFLRYNVSIKKLEIFFIIISIVSTIIYLINFVNFPNLVFGNLEFNISTNRGIPRIPIPFLDIIILVVYYSINKLNMSSRKIWILPVFLGIIIICMSVVRQVIFFALIVAMLLWLKQISLWKKIILIVSALAIYLYIIPQIEIFKNLTQITQEQVHNQQTADLRTSSLAFFTYGYQTNALTPFIGNGMTFIGDGNTQARQSVWGKNFEILAENHDAHITDVGWVGFFWNFGIFAAVALFLLMFNGAKLIRNNKYLYLKYWLYFEMLLGLFSGPILYNNQIMTIMLISATVYGNRKVFSERI
jgi:hypothetical protein